MTAIIIILISVPLPLGRLSFLKSQELDTSCDQSWSVVVYIDNTGNLLY